MRRKLSNLCDAVGQDLKYAFRMYRRSPAFTLTALLAISIGMGASVAVFSVADRILFRPLPFHEARELVSLGMVAIVVNDGEFLFPPDYKELLHQKTPLQSATSWSGVEDCDISEPHATRERCAEVDWNFLNVLGVHPIAGSGFTRNDVQPGAPKKALLSYGLWRNQFASDFSVVGRTVSLDGAPVRIAGILPPDFELPTLQHADLLTSQVLPAEAWQHNTTRVLRVIGRLRYGIEVKAGRTQLESFFQSILREVPAPFRKEVQFRVQSLRDRQMGWARVAAWTLLGAVLAVLCISCTNVANLLLARTAGRTNELAIRRALGVSKARLAGQMLAESLLLALTGGAIGCGLSVLLLRLAIAANPDAIPHLADATLDGRVLVMALLLSVISGVAFGFTPLIHARREGSIGSSRSVTGRASSGLKNGLMAAPIAVSLVLVSAAGLLVRSLWNLENQPLGMDTHHILAAQIVLPAVRYRKPEQRVAFFNDLERQLTSTPGVRAVGLSDSLPPAGWERSRPLSAIHVVGEAERRREGTGGLIDWRYVSPGYFEALHIPVLQGRGFTEADRASGVNLCMLSRSLANKLFANQNPIGQKLRIGVNNPVEVVGVVPDVKNTGLSAITNPEYYILRTHSADDVYVNGTGPVAQRTLSIVVRADIPDATLAFIVRRDVASLDETIPVDIQTMSDRLGELSAGPRFDTLILIIFASIGLLLAAVGLYGTVAYLVAQRTQEIGIRMSLGAQPWGIAGLLLGYATKWTAIGGMIGVVASLMLTRLMSSLLFRVSAHDPFTLVAAVVCLFAVAIAASVGPARRAAQTDPVEALRSVT